MENQSVAWKKMRRTRKEENGARIGVCYSAGTEKNSKVENGVSVN